MSEDKRSVVQIYDEDKPIGKVTFNELKAFLDHKKEVGNIYHHKLNFEMGTALHIIRQMRNDDANGEPEFGTKRINYKLTTVAVIAAMLIGMAWWFFKPASPVDVASTELVAAVSDKAMLTLENGAQINLSDARAGVVYAEPGLQIVKVKEGQIAYRVKSGHHAAVAGAQHMITTPTGAQFEVLLPDGTAVWLNAESSLKFPETFVSVDARRISLTGEAYFEVAHDKTKPFYVSSKGQDIQVLGTHFNVNAYGNENSVKTTLLEGSLRVTSKTDKQSVLLKPQQQAILDGNTLSVNSLKADDTTSWKDGEYIFRNMPMEDVMRTVERWFGVKVSYQNDKIKRSLLGGTIVLSGNLPDVLEILELSAGVQFKIEGRSVTVLK
jgi:transmembrane sensor